MADFSHLKALDVVASSVAEYTFHQITVNGKTPVLTVSPATDANKPYFNALLKRSAKSSRQVRSGNINTGLIDENRDEDRELYPKHIVKSWSGVVDANGKDSAFSASNCVDFLSAIPNWVLDDFFAFCREPANFAELMDVKTKGGNSSSGSSGS